MMFTHRYANVIAIGVIVLASAAHAQVLFDAVDSHEWIAETAGSPITVDHVDFQGRRCLRGIVTAATANSTSIRTKRFLSEDWTSPVTAIRADVYVTGAGNGARLNLQTRAFADYNTIVASVQSGILINDQWQTVTWTLPAAVGLDQIGHVSLLLNNIATFTPTVYVDDMRLVGTPGGDQPWDAMDNGQSWIYVENWNNWSGITPPTAFPGIEPISSLDGSPASPTASAYLEWDFNNGELPGNSAAAVGVDGGGAGLNADFSQVDRINAWVRSSSNNVSFRVYFYDADTDFGFITHCNLAQSVDTWEQLSWFIAWPPGFDRIDVDIVYFVVSEIAIDNAPTGWARFDHITTEAGDPPPAPELAGRWLSPQAWPVTAIHAAMMPTGQVLHYAYPGGGPGSRAFLWDYETGSFEDVSMNTDLFCSGHSLLPDGTLYITGGNDYDCQFQGRVDTHTFDAFTSTWTKLADMTVGRWYPTNVTLGDGRVIVVSGLDRNCVGTPVMEMYTPGVGLEVIPEGANGLPLYPLMHLLTDGTVGYVGPSPQSSIYDPVARNWQFVDSSNAGWRGSGTSVLVPGEPDNIMIIGGANNGVTTSTCERIDFSAATPQWVPDGSLSIPRAHANAVILPNRKIMLVGGGDDGLYCEPTNVPEMYDPDTRTWSTLPRQVFGRMYHSTAVLLPDARVLSAGQDSDNSGSWGEIYEPAYLFQGPRPTITGAPKQIAYGASFLLNTPDAASIGSVALIRPSVVTHSVNMEQRYVGLSFTANDANGLSIVAPGDGNAAPPGYYMLFILNDLGVPSVAEFVQLLEQIDPIPAVSEWGLVVMILLTITTGTLILRLRSPLNRRVLRSPCAPGSR